MVYRFVQIFLLVLFPGILWQCHSPTEEEVHEVYIPPMVTFAGDTVPVWDPEIRERLEKELYINTYWQSNTALWIKRSGRWFPMIDSILKKNQIPEDFKYLVPVESGFENVTSGKGAVGFWQIMEPTAKEFGLMVNEEIDHRLDPARATEAACKLLLRGKKVLGNWVSVAASYNVGISGLNKVMEAQYTDRFYDLIINQETGRYFFRALAAKLILGNPEKYGFHNLKPYAAYETKTLKLDSSVHDLAFWCRQNGFSYKCFRMVNPWIKTGRILISDSLPVVSLSIPLNCPLYTKLELKPIPVGIKDSIQIARQGIIENLVNKKDIKAHAQVEKSLKKTQDFHVVKAGESLSLIVMQYHLTTEALFALNPGLASKQHKIYSGMKIRIAR
jgi:hypothetical protein